MVVGDMHACRPGAARQATACPYRSDNAVASSGGRSGSPSTTRRRRFMSTGDPRSTPWASTRSCGRCCSTRAPSTRRLRPAGLGLVGNCTPAPTPRSPNVVTSQTKTKTIPMSSTSMSTSTLPGETHADVEEHLRQALGDIYDQVSVEVPRRAPTQSRIDTLWDSMQKAVANPFPTSRSPRRSCRLHRRWVYETSAPWPTGGPLSPTLTPAVRPCPRPQ